MFFKLISLLVIWSWKCSSILKKKITSLWTLVIWVCKKTFNIFPRWIYKPRIRKHKNHSKASSGAGRFAQHFRACKKTQYNVRNCKYGRHNQCHTFRRRNSRYIPTYTNIPYYGLKVKRRKKGNNKTPSRRQQNRMLHAIKHRHNTSLWISTRMLPPFLPFDAPNLCNDYIFMDSQYNDWSVFLTRLIQIPIC